MKEAVVLSLLFAILSIGFCQDFDNFNNATGNHSSTEASTAHATSTPPQPTTGHTGLSSSTSRDVTTANPPPKPDDVYAVLGNNHTYCILIKANFSVEFSYRNKTDQKQIITGAAATIRVPQPNEGNVSVSGSCGEKTQSIAISFKHNWTLTLYFEKANDKYYQSNISLDWDFATSGLKDAPEGSGLILNGTHLFDTSTGYLCMARRNLYENKSAENDVSLIYTENLHLEAFQHKTEPKITNDKYERCSEDSISNLVPIIVGACLGGLIIIVLIAYLIGRKRSRRGYESV